MTRMDRLHRTGLGRGINSDLEVICLFRDRTYTLGRGSDQNIRIIDNMISRKHAILRYCGESWKIEDKQSLNKTFVNGNELTPHHASPLLNGDILRLGVVVEQEARDYKFELVASYLTTASATSGIPSKPKTTAAKEFNVEEIVLGDNNNEL